MRLRRRFLWFRILRIARRQAGMAEGIGRQDPDSGISAQPEMESHLSSRQGSRRRIEYRQTDHRQIDHR